VPRSDVCNGCGLSTPCDCAGAGSRRVEVDASGAGPRCSGCSVLIGGHHSSGCGLRDDSGLVHRWHCPPEPRPPVRVEAFTCAECKEPVAGLHRYTCAYQTRYDGASVVLPEHAKAPKASQQLRCVGCRVIVGGLHATACQRGKDLVRVAHCAERRAMKFDAGKLRYDLVDPFALAWLVAALTYGVSKYAANNWRGFPPEELREKYAAAMMRHFEAWRAGENDDAETGLPHLALMSFGAMVITSTFAPRDMSEVVKRTAEAIRRWQERKP
jgi:hypothetical protein